MKKWWIGAALAAMCVGQSAWGQDPSGGALLPEPAPVAPCPPRDPGQRFMPGPLTGNSAPQGPQDGLSLPRDIPTAWGKGPSPDAGLYFQVGAMALMRQRPGHSAIATDQDFVVQDTHELNPGYNIGGRATIGYLYEDTAIELTGFYVPEQETSISLLDPGNLTLFFRNPPQQFLGLSGNGIWTPADHVTTTLQYSLGNAELNYRWWSRALTGVEGIIGFRYVELQERATITADNNISFAFDGGRPDATLEATYQSRIHNHMLMPQTGFEWDMPIRPWLGLTLIGKAAFGANNAEVTTRLTNAAGLVGAQGRHSEWDYASLYQFDACLDFMALERLHVRMGYTAMWLLHVGEALGQIDYDLAHQPGTKHNNGSIFFHGPLVEVQFLF